MRRETADIAIVGAGIAGLTTALALARRDRACVVYEKARTLSEAGAGIQLSPNASRILIDLGLEQGLLRHAAAPDRIALFRGTSGEPLADIPLGRQALERYGAPYWVIHRADLQDVLVRAVMANPRIILRRGAAFAQIEDDSRRARLTVTLDTPVGPETRNHDAVIGADGLWSAMRIALGDRSRPRFSGYRAYRAVVPRESLPEAFRQPIVGAWLGPQGHVVHYPVIKGFSVNLVAIVADATWSRGWAEPASAEHIRAAFSSWARDVRDALAVPKETWRSWALFDRPSTPPPNGAGSTTLIGDAAHPMLPFLAQGGGMAIEDAAALADEYVVNPGRPQAAFRALESIRSPRVAAVQKAARNNGRIFHMSGLPAKVRDSVLTRMSSDMLVRRFDWLYGYRG